MPDSFEKRRNSSAEEVLPEDQARQHRQIEPDAKVGLAEGEGGIEPAGAELQADQELAKDAPAAQGLHRIHEGTQQHPRQETAQQPPCCHRRGQRSRLRLERGAS